MKCISYLTKLISTFWYEQRFTSDVATHKINAVPTYFFKKYFREVRCEELHKIGSGLFIIFLSLQKSPQAINKGNENSFHQPLLVRIHGKTFIEKKVRDDLRREYNLCKKMHVFGNLLKMDMCIKEISGENRTF